MAVQCTCRVVFFAFPENSDARDVFSDASLQTSVNLPRTRPLKCMEQSAFLFNLNQERIEMTKTLKNIVKYIISYALLMKQKNSWSICGFHGPKTTHP